MAKRRTIQVNQGTYDRINAIASRCDSKLYGVVAWLTNAWEMLTAEQKAAAMTTAEPSSPSLGDARHGAKHATAKQPPTHRLPTARRKAG